MNLKKTTFAAAGMAVLLAMAQNTNVIDEVIWIVGDEPIYRSEVEEHYSQLKLEGTDVPSNPYCKIPEQLAVEKLYLHQAKVDTIEAPAGMVNSAVEKRLNAFIAGLGSKERVESHFRKPIPDLKTQLAEIISTQYIIGQVQESLTKDVKGTPSEVKKYFASLPEDSVPYVPLQVEAQIITLRPAVPQEEIEDVKSRLRDYAERVNSGETPFSSLAIMYSEDDGSAMQGGELGFHGKADFVPEFSNVAFNLNDPKKVSRIVETEYGYHILQLIEKRGDQVNVRHILLRPKVRDEDIKIAVNRLDTLRGKIIEGLGTFEEAARLVSHDKDTRSNKGKMVNPRTGTTRFEMQDLPAEAAMRIESMKPGDISEAFVMKDPARNMDVVAIVKLTERIPGHKASLAEDYNMLKQMYEEHAKLEIIKKWVEKKINETYVKIEDGWNNCDFEYKGWIK